MNSQVKYLALGLLVYFQVLFLHSIWINTINQVQKNKYIHFEQRLVNLESKVKNKTDEIKGVMK